MNILNAHYMPFLSLLAIFLVVMFLHEKRLNPRSRVFMVCSAVVCLYLARFTAITTVNGALGEPAHFWLGLARLLSFGGFVFAIVPAVRLAASGTERLSPDQEEAPQGEPRKRSSWFAQTGIAAAVAAMLYGGVSVVSPVAFSVEQLVNVVLAGVAVRVLTIVAPAIAGRFQEAKAGVFFTGLLFAFSWIAFHAVISMRQYLPESIMILSRAFDYAALASLLMALVSIRTAQRVKFRHFALANRQKVEETRDELSKLTRLTAQIHEDNNEVIRKLKNQNKLLVRRGENLEKTLQMGLEIQKQQDLRDMLQRIVELVRENLGFETVVLRLLIEKTQSFESKAYVGVSEEMEGTVLNYRVPKSEFQRMIEPHFRISKSYFIRNSSPWYGESLDNYQTLNGHDAWREIDMLVVPMQTDDDKILGYLSVENPKTVDIPVSDVIENLESIAALAVTAIKNANIFVELEEKNDKLRIYADKLESLNKMKSNFVATISHEFKTPLTSIKAYCETLLNNADEVERSIIKEFLMVINDESNRLMTLIEDILNFSKMESGAMKFERGQCSLNRVLRAAAGELEQNFQNKKIKLDIVSPARDIVIRADADMIKQLVLNLLHNAAKFTPEEGNVHVILEDETVSAKIIVEDTGTGIPEDQMEKIFEHFHQVDNSSTRKHGGSGLGLALCKNIAEWHDGKIWAENVDNAGSRFIVVLPKKQVVVRNQTDGLSGAVRRFEVERYLELLIEMVAELLSVKRASIMLFDVSKSELKIESAIGIDEEVVENARVKLGDSISGRVLADGRTLLVEDIEHDPRVSMCNNEFLYESKSFLSVPIKIDGSTVGVVNVSNPTRKPKFDAEDQGLLEMFVERIALALQKLEEFTHVSEDFEKIREAMKSIMDAKRFIYNKNDMDIPSIVTMAADKLKLDREEKAMLRYALNVYDVGLVKIGYHIIKKPSELTQDEREKIRDHTILGIEMLKTLEAMPKVKDIVLYHHENFDGSGYPGKLSGKSIPIGARIIRVVDSFRALISNRPYQRQYSVDEAIEVLRHRSGSFYDPEVVDAFIDSIQEYHEKQDDISGHETEPGERHEFESGPGIAAPQLKEENNAER